ncbi:MAG TPA: hypothetical protein VG222_05565 [Vicinamibacterales bacterium]|nr:hypothetical protein [Vicinamibacterales bacterium]
MPALSATSGDRRRPGSTHDADQRPGAGSADPRTSAIFAASLPPIAVPSASEGQSFVVPVGTDVVALQFEGGIDAAKAANARVVIQGVAGSEIWGGPVSSTADLPPGVIA